MTIWQFTLIVLATAALSLTISKSSMFQGFRDWMAWWPTAQKMVSCPYCLSHYFGLCFATYYQPPPALDVIVAWFAIVAGTAIVAGLIDHFFMWRDREIAQLTKALEDIANGQ